MQINQTSMAAVFRGLKAAFVDAVKEATVEVLDGLVEEVPSTTTIERYPTSVALGDLERLLDEYASTNLGAFLQAVENVPFGRIVSIPRDHISDDQLGLYTPGIRRLGRLAETHFNRHIPYLFVSSDGTATGGQGGGFQTAWVDGANVFSNTHAWPGGQAWDNLDSLPLTQANFETVVQHLEERLGPDGQPMDLRATVLIVGPRQHVNAKNIVERLLIGGGNSNIHYEEVTVVKHTTSKNHPWTDARWASFGIRGFRATEARKC